MQQGALRRWVIAVAAESRVTIVDMSSHFEDHPEWHLTDGLHFTPLGSEQLADLISDAIAPLP